MFEDLLKTLGSVIKASPTPSGVAANITSYLSEEDKEPVTPIEPGNIDWRNRKGKQNPDGSVSTVKSVSINDGTGEVLIPTITEDGLELDLEAAIVQYKTTGNHLGKFKNPEEATKYAKWLSGEQDKRVSEEEVNASPAKATDDGSLDFSETDPMAILLNMGTDEDKIRKDIKPVRLMTDFELKFLAADESQPNYENARNELALRSRWEKQSLEENLMDADYVKRHAAELADQFVTSVVKVPGDAMQIAGMVASVPSALGVSDVGAETGADLLAGGADYREGVNEAFRMTEPRNPLETLASIGPAAGLRVATKAPQTLAGNIAEVITPFTFGGGKARQAVNIGAQFTGAEALRPILASEGDEYKTIFERVLTPEEAYAQSADPDLDFEIGRTQDDLEIRNSDLSKVGVLGLATIGAMVAPSTIRYFKSKFHSDSLKELDPTDRFYPAGLQTTVKPLDIVHTQWVDPMFKTLQGLERAGLDVNELRLTTDLQTSANLQNKIGQAIETGYMPVMDGVDFKAPKNADGSVLSPSRLRHYYDTLPPEMQKAANEYADLHSRLGIMDEQSLSRLWGMTKTSIRNRIRQLRQQYGPTLDDMQTGVKRTNQALHEFLASGEFAIVDKTKKWDRNYYARELDEEFWGDNITRRYGSNFNYKKNMPEGEYNQPFDQLLPWTEQMLRSKVLNSVRGAYVDMMKKAPQKIIHRLPKSAKARNKALSDHPNWKNKVVRIYRRGKPEYYVMDQLWADTLKLDPNFSVHPSWYKASRVFQFNTTGYGAPWFAPLRFLRDINVAQVTTPEGYKNIGVPGLAHARAGYAFVDGLVRKEQLALADTIYKAIDSGNSPLLKMFSKSGLRSFANNQAASYYRSIYHMFNARGGSGVSYSQNAVQGAKGKIAAWMEKAVAADPSGVSKHMGRIWMNLIDSMQNAPIYGTARRNIISQMKKKGGKLSNRELDQLAADIKPITGDITITGRSFVKTGRGKKDYRPVGIDEKRSGQTLIQSSGELAQFLREANPWTNALIQGLRRLGVSYWKDPVRFTMRTWAYVGLPQLAAYTTAMSMGPEYLDYMMTKRSEYDKSTKIYIPPFWEDEGNRHPANGIQIPVGLEVAPIGYMFLNSLDYMIRGGGVDSGAVAKTIMNSFFGLTTPPLLTGGAALSYGIELPSTLPGFGEQPYEPQANPYGAFPRIANALGFEQNVGNNIELAIRNFFGSSADVYIGFLNATLEEGDMVSGVKEAWYQTKQKIPIIRENRQSAFTDLNQKNREYVEKMREMEKIHRTWIRGEGFIQSSRPATAIPGAASIDVEDNGKIPGRIVAGTVDLGNVPFMSLDQEPFPGALPAGPVQAQVFKLDDGTFGILPVITGGGKRLKTDKGNVSPAKVKRAYKQFGMHYGIFEDADSAENYLEKLRRGEVKVVEEPFEEVADTEGMRAGRAPVPEPTNWVYVALADSIHQKFETDGWGGFKNLTKSLGQVTDSVRSLKKLNAGSLDQWKEHINSLPEESKLKARLMQVDTKDRKQVQKVINQYEDMRVALLKRIQFYTKQAERELTDQVSGIAGKEVKVDLLNLDPWGEPPVPMPGLFP